MGLKYEMCTICALENSPTIPLHQEDIKVFSNVTRIIDKTNTKRFVGLRWPHCRFAIKMYYMCISFTPN